MDQSDVDQTTADDGQGTVPDEGQSPPQPTDKQWIIIACFIVAAVILAIILPCWAWATRGKFNTSDYVSKDKAGQKIVGPQNSIRSGLFAPRVSIMNYMDANRKVVSLAKGTGKHATYGFSQVQTAPGPSNVPSLPDNSLKPSSQNVIVLPNDDATYYILAQQTGFSFPQQSNIAKEFQYLDEVPPVMFVTTTGLALAYAASLSGVLTGEVYVAKTSVSSTDVTVWDAPVLIATIPEIVAAADVGTVTLSAVGRLNVRMAVTVSYKGSGGNFQLATILSDSSGTVWAAPVTQQVEWRTTPDAGDTLTSIAIADNDMHTVAGANATTPSNQILMTGYLVTFDNGGTPYTSQLITQWTLDAGAGTLGGYETQILSEANTTVDGQQCPRLVVTLTTTYAGYNNGTDLHILKKNTTQSSGQWVSATATPFAIPIDNTTGFLIHYVQSVNKFWVVSSRTSSVYVDDIGVVVGDIDVATGTITFTNTLYNLPASTGVNARVYTVTDSNAGGLLYLCANTLGANNDAVGLTYLTTDADPDDNLSLVGTATFATNVDSTHTQYVFPPIQTVTVTDPVPRFVFYSTGSLASDGMAVYSESEWQASLYVDTYAPYGATPNTYDSVVSTAQGTQSSSSSVELTPTIAHGRRDEVSGRRNVANAVLDAQNHGWHVSQLRRTASTVNGKEVRARMAEVFKHNYQSCDLCLRETNPARTLRDVALPVQVNAFTARQARRIRPRRPQKKDKGMLRFVGRGTGRRRVVV